MNDTKDNRRNKTGSTYSLENLVLKVDPNNSNRELVHCNEIKPHSLSQKYQAFKFSNGPSISKSQDVFLDWKRIRKEEKKECCLLM